MEYQRNQDFDQKINEHPTFAAGLALKRTIVDENTMWIHVGCPLAILTCSQRYWKSAMSDCDTGLNIWDDFGMIWHDFFMIFDGFREQEIEENQWILYTLDTEIHDFLENCQL